MTYLALDPGLYTGWALFDSHGNTKQTGIFTGIDLFEDFLETINADDMIIEDYTDRPWTPKGGSKHHAAQIVGIAKAWCEKNNVPYHMQDPSIKPIAYKWLGKKNKHKHDEDAEAHGVYWLQKNKIRKSRLLT